MSRYLFPEKDGQAEPREKIVVRTSIIGILANVMLAAFKAVVGALSHSIAIVLDAVNNLSDAVSSVITIIGTKLAGRAPDKKHPFGHGRAEYLSAMIISVIILYAGITSLVESVKKIIAPETPDYTPVALIIVGVAVVVKLLLGRYAKSVGRKVNSDSLVNSGEDASLDAIISASTLVAAAIYLLWGISLEAWLGAIISLVIIKSGYEMLRETLSHILGEGADAELARDIKSTICSFPQVEGAYDLILNNYGPDNYTGSVHIEVPDTLTMDELDQLTRDITYKVLNENGIIMTAVGVYSVNTQNKETLAMRKAIEEAVLSLPHILEMHGFYVFEQEKYVRFDLVVSLDAPDRAQAMAAAREKVQAMYPDYRFYMIMDTDFSQE